MYRLLPIIFFIVAIQHAASAAPISMESNSNIQVIHNSADTTLRKIDLYLNGTKILSGLSFREATPFFTVPSDSILALQIARSPSSSALDTLRSFPVYVEGGKSTSIVLQGVVDTLLYKQNPSGKSIGLTIVSLENIQQTYSATNEIPVRIVNGCTDMPEVNLVAKDVAPLLSNMTFGSSTPLDIVMPTASYDFLLLASGNQSILKEFPVNLKGQEGHTAVIFFSGFYEPFSNNNGQKLGLFGALPNGSIIDFQKITPVNESKALQSNYRFTKIGSIITVESSNSLGEEICLYDCNGRLVKSTKHNSSQTFISTENIATGLYFLVVNYGTTNRALHQMIVD